MSDYNYDIIIIGGGPAGYPAAIYAKTKGLKVALIEASDIGGTCLNKGCIPTKTLIKSANLYEEFLESENFGINAENVTFDWPKITDNKNNVVLSLVRGISTLLDFRGVDIYSGKGIIVDKHTIRVQMKEDIYLTSQNILIATGSKSTMVPVPGNDLEGVITSTEALSFNELPKSIVIIGGGVVGTELSYIFNAFGVDVTIIEMLPNILSGHDEDTIKVLKASLLKKGLNIITDAKLTKIEQINSSLKVSYETAAGIQSLISEKVLMATGRKPNLSAIGEFALNNDHKGIVVDDYLCTNVPNIYAVGDVTGKVMLAHVATHQAITAVNNILGDDQKMNYDVIPSCIYTIPELASVGLTEKEAIKRVGEIEIGRFNFAANGKAKTIHQVEGFVKIICDKKYGEILGVHIVGPNATELIAEAALAIQLECTVEELVNTIHAHPTLSESIMEAAQKVLGYSIHSV